MISVFALTVWKIACTVERVIVNLSLFLCCSILMT